METTWEDTNPRTLSPEKMSTKAIAQVINYVRSSLAHSVPKLNVILSNLGNIHEQNSILTQHYFGSFWMSYSKLPST